MRVPLAYGLCKSPSKIRATTRSKSCDFKLHARISFETTNILRCNKKRWYHSNIKASDGSKLRKVFMPVPYNIGFELNILVKLNDDALQIVEQILPYFQPSFNVTIDL